MSHAAHRTRFAEHSITADDGQSIRYLQAGSGSQSVMFVTHDPDVSITPAHDLLAERYHVLAFGLAGVENSPAMLCEAARQLRLGHFSLWGAAAGGRDALMLAATSDLTIDSLVLEAPDPPADDCLELRTLTVPTLVVYGTRDTVVPPETGRRYRQQLPNCHYVLVYAAGHSPSVDRPEAFASLVGDFVARREAFIVTQTSSLLHP